MTSNQLKQYQSILQELPEIDRKIKKTEEEIEKLITEGTVIDSVSGGAGGTQHFRIEGMPEKALKTKRIDVYVLRYTKTRMEKQKRDVEDFLNRMDDFRMKRIIRYRFFDGLRWQEVADKMGGNCTEDSVKKEFQRFMKKT